MFSFPTQKMLFATTLLLASFGFAWEMDKPTEVGAVGGVAKPVLRMKTMRAGEGQKMKKTPYFDPMVRMGDIQGIMDGFESYTGKEFPKLIDGIGKQIMADIEKALALERAKI